MTPSPPRQNRPDIFPLFYLRISLDPPPFSVILIGQPPSKAFIFRMTVLTLLNCFYYMKFDQVPVPVLAPM